MVRVVLIRKGEEAYWLLVILSAGHPNLGRGIAGGDAAPETFGCQVGSQRPGGRPSPPRSVPNPQ